MLASLLLAASPAVAAPSFEAAGSVEQVYVTGLDGGQRATLSDRRGDRVAARSANPMGGLLFRNVDPGRGYRVEAGGETSGRLRVLSARSAPPDTSIYEQEIPTRGYGYLTTRDGTRLAINVHPPEDVTDAFGITVPSLSSGKRPTLIEYGGYGYADPAGPESGISLLANLMGFTVVDVNMRGTGCSGGAFDFFEPLQSLDGYDVIETVARQPWVHTGKVGMMGISYGGISQLFTASTQPPSLAAIAPLSVLDQTQTTLYPGGILNTGFALEWALDRVEDAKPAGAGQGQAWAYERIQGGDQVCADNQVMHGEAKDLLKKIRRNNHYKPKVADPISPATFVDKIEVPTFMACQWTDEQTGGHCPNLADRFTGTDRKWFTFTNGTHIDALSPETFNRWYDFMKIYVAEQSPITNAALVQLAAPIIFQEAMGIPGLTLPTDPIQLQPTLAGARNEFEKLGQVRVLFDNGAGRPARPGAPYPGFEYSFPRFPAPGTSVGTWFLSQAGKLESHPPRRTARASFRADPHSTPLTNFTGDTGSGKLWSTDPGYEWKEHASGASRSWITPSLAKDTIVLGAGAVRLWVRSAKRDVDLQATISEVRPDGKEVFVQGGWVRASTRKLDRKKSSRLEPVLSLRKRDAKPMPKGRFAKITIPLYYEGHAYREGSRIRLTLSGPNGDQPVWAFANAKPKKGATKVAVSSSKRRSSTLMLPVMEGLDIPTTLPACPGLRGQPCRDYAGR